MHAMLREHPDRTGPLAAGFVLTYRPGYTNFCPGCGQAHWHVGRVTAECARCMTALPIAMMAREPAAPEPLLVRRHWLDRLPLLRAA